MKTFLTIAMLMLIFPINSIGKNNREKCVFSKHCSNKKALCIAKLCINPGTKEYCSITLSKNRLTISGHIFSKAQRVHVIRSCWSCTKGVVSEGIRCLPKYVKFSAYLPKGGGTIQLNAHGFRLYIEGRRIIPSECKLKGLIGSNLTMGRFRNKRPFQMFSSKKSSAICNQCKTKKKKPAFCIPLKCSKMRGRFNRKTMHCIKCKPKDTTCNKWSRCTKIRCP